jgi:hypothetical protein
MPIPENLRDVFETVSKATDEGRAPWKAAPIKGMFFLALEDFSVQIWKRSVFRKPPVAAGVATGTPTIDMNLLDANGKRFEGFTLDSSDSDFNNLAELVEKACRAAESRTDERLSKFKQQLTEKLGA